MELHTEGLQYLLEVTLSEEQTVPANLYIGLATDAAPAENQTLAGLTEIISTGYARQTVATDNVDITSQAAGTNDWEALLKQVTFANSSGGAWTAFSTVFVATTSDDTGKLLASAAVTGAPLTLNDGDDYKPTIKIRLTG